MTTIKIPDTTLMGIAGQGEFITLAIFLEESLELEMSLNVAKVIADTLALAIDIGTEQERAI